MVSFLIGFFCVTLLYIVIYLGIEATIGGTIGSLGDIAGLGLVVVALSS